MGLNGLPGNMNYEVCKFVVRLAGYGKMCTSVSYFAVKYEETLLCELFITLTHSESFWY